MRKSSRLLGLTVGTTSADSVGFALFHLLTLALLNASLFTILFTPLHKKFILTQHQSRKPFSQYKLSNDITATVIQVRAFSCYT
jgi:hypothetical protein